MEKNSLHNQHLLWRAGFGPAVEQLPDLHRFTAKQYFTALQKASAASPVPLDVIPAALKEEMDSPMAGRRRELTAEERKERQQLSREGIRQLNLTWMHAMINSSAQLREKMAFFWHGHFACRTQNLLHQQQLINVIREKALGNFGDLLRGVSKSGAMINFLNNQQNRKDHPNENFAREVMELFTMGRGHYTEQDIKEAARAFTGWSALPSGEFIFRKFQHDTGVKTILGRKGNFQGEDVLQLLLEQKETARFITRKLWRFLVNDIPDESKIEKLAADFYQSGYQIMPLLESIFLSDWFYAPRHIGSILKSPVELIVGFRRMIPLELQREEAILLLQRALGQVLFYPPNVAGWPGGKNWIDSSSLLLRMRLPLLLTSADEFNVGAKDDDDVMMGLGKRGEGLLQLIGSSTNWNLFFTALGSTSREKLPSAIQQFLLQVPIKKGPDLIAPFADASSRESFIRSYALHVMSMPEYQLC
jgi:uncharacterized protein (DUF1800 family)